MKCNKNIFTNTYFCICPNKLFPEVQAVSYTISHRWLLDRVDLVCCRLLSFNRSKEPGGASPPPASAIAPPARGLATAEAQLETTSARLSVTAPEVSANTGVPLNLGFGRRSCAVGVTISPGKLDPWPRTSLRLLLLVGTNALAAELPAAAARCPLLSLLLLLTQAAAIIVDERSADGSLSFPTAGVAVDFATSSMVVAVPVEEMTCSLDSGESA